MFPWHSPVPMASGVHRWRGHIQKLQRLGTVGWGSCRAGGGMGWGWVAWGCGKQGVGPNRWLRHPSSYGSSEPSHLPSQGFLGSRP